MVRPKLTNINFGLAGSGAYLLVNDFLPTPKSTNVKLNNLILEATTSETTKPKARKLKTNKIIYEGLAASI